MFGDFDIGNKNTSKTCWEILILVKKKIGKTCWENLILVRNSGMLEYFDISQKLW